jgi:hypothetical protein
MRSQTIRCGYCGSGVTVEELEATAYCPYCGQQLPLEPLRGELAGYQAAVGAKLQQIERERKHAAAWDRWSDDSSRRPGRSMAVAFGLMMGVPVLLSLGGFLLYRVGALELRGPGLSITIMVASYLGVIGYIVWYYRRRKGRSAQAQAPGAVAVACPTCGAPGQLPPGQSAGSCAYCGGALVPTRTVMRRSLDEVQASVRQAEIMRYRKQREGMANVMAYSSSATRYVPVFAMAPFLIGVLVLPFGWTYAMVWGDEPFNPTVFLAYGLVFGGVGGGVLFLRYRRRKRRALSAALEALARQHGGRVLSELKQWVGWLNAYWAGEYGANEIYQGPYGGAVMMDAAGYPVLMIFDAAGQDQYRPRKLHILLAAWVPGASDSTSTVSPPMNQDAQPLRDSLARQGFTVHVDKAGVRAWAHDEQVKQLAKDPAALRELAPVITTITRLAQAVGATPVSPL